MEDLSLMNFAPIIAFNILSIILFGVLMHFSSKKEKREIDKIKRESDLAIKESEFIRKESKKLLEELEIEKEKNFKLQIKLQLELEKYSLANLELEKDSLANKPCKPKPISKPRVSKYDKPNTLYIAYDFNISGNQSYAKIINHIVNAANNEIRPAIKTTSIVFFNYLYTPVFEDIILVKKNGASISLAKLYDSPGYYINRKLSLFNIVLNDRKVLADLNYLLARIVDNEIKFVKEKEL